MLAANERAMFTSETNVRVRNLFTSVDLDNDLQDFFPSTTPFNNPNKTPTNSLTSQEELECYLKVCSNLLKG